MNKVTFIGRMAKDPELRYTTQNNRAVVNFPIAVDRRLVLGKDKETDFFNVVAWQATGEFVMRNFKKGQPIAIAGRLQQRSWIDEETQTTRYAIEVIAEDVHFAGFMKEQAQSNQNTTTYDPNFDPYAGQVAA